MSQQWQTTLRSQLASKYYCCCAVPLAHCRQVGSFFGRTWNCHTPAASQQAAWSPFWSHQVTAGDVVRHQPGIGVLYRHHLGVPTATSVDWKLREQSWPYWYHLPGDLCEMWYQLVIVQRTPDLQSPAQLFTSC